MQHTTFLALAKERSVSTLLREQLSGVREALQKSNERNGSYSDTVRALQRQIAQASYKLKRQEEERLQAMRKAAFMQSKFAEQRSRLGQVGRRNFPARNPTLID
jgi:translation initiation factor 2B subunit (eIF-2B alpha/beta/delta family)